jgi:hypothetical protein
MRARRDHHTAPVRAALVQTIATEPDFGAIGEHWCDRGHAQFGGLLQNQIHLLAAGDALQQYDSQRRFVVDRTRTDDRGFDAAFGHGKQARVVVVAVAVEQDAGFAFAHAQHAHQVAACVLRQVHARAGHERRIDEDASESHAAASSKAARVASANSANCASSMQ